MLEGAVILDNEVHLNGFIVSSAKACCDGFWIMHNLHEEKWEKPICFITKAYLWYKKVFPTDFFATKKERGNKTRYNIHYSSVYVSVRMYATFCIIETDELLLQAAVV